MAAAVAKPTTEYLKEALAAVTTSDVYEWAHDLLGPSVQNLRQKVWRSEDESRMTAALRPTSFQFEA